jgi:hypothetical protein
VGNKRIDKNEQGEQARDPAYLPTSITRIPAISSKALKYDRPRFVACALRAFSKTNFRQVDALAQTGIFAPQAIY